MNEIQKYEIKLDKQTNEYTLFIYLNDSMTEFANELGTVPKTKRNFMATARQIIHTRYPNVKVSMVKIMAGGMVVTSLAMGTNISTSEAAELSNTSEVINSSGIYYKVEAGDTLYSIAKKYNSSVANIKRANNLTSDTVKLNQPLIIPKAIHTVQPGDTLWSLMNKFGIGINEIKDVNNLTEDTLTIGQSLIIPAPIGGANNGNVSSTKVTKTSTYKVVTGDTLYSLANKFGTSVNEIKSANHLTTDSLSIGQTLQIPGNASSVDTTERSADTTQSYKVTSGDTLYSIANKFGTSVDSMKQSNNLTSNLLSIGQTLKIPTTSKPETTPNSSTANQKYTVNAGDTLWSVAKRFGMTVNALKSENNLTSDTLQVGQTLTINQKENSTQSTPKASEQQSERTTFQYTVKSGENLSVIANRFDVSVNAIKSVNNLKADLLQVGQILEIPDGLNAPDLSTVNSISYTTHTIESGDNIWDLSIKYGIPQSELLKVNNLTTNSRLSIGQKLRIPVHHIAVKEVVSEKHGEYMDWWTEAQYVFTIGKKAKVTDMKTGKSFFIQRTIGANHADSETVSTNDTNIAKSIWGGFSWTPRAVVLEIDGRKIAASMSFMPHEREFIANNGITGHFDVYFGNSTRHKDGKADASHEARVKAAAGIR
ncbi:LysM peptidoglycan-binding domain-containing protein [Oceanobacillus halophilus]|uniref:LysM peptidoglycan-binding domain-containing protein n=1 Tax=Oceanobacillus halophilus TaxID=930130 RepID=A0A494ZXI5_9BACI|nr:LysM peptidoglycan-binding domain-containing protein [Oceanobacillus halophilus]RKQ30774.1 LysM peptidoglycan-binding domain-containing protein [Oceanobacillus halophilus]